jgi:hypothetical protein
MKMKFKFDYGRSIVQIHIHTFHQSTPIIAQLDLPKSDPNMAHLPPVMRFGYFEASQRLESSFENSIVLTDSAGLGRNRIEVALWHQMLQHNWIARFYDEYWFLIEAPNPRCFLRSHLEVSSALKIVIC